jgi:hypothetical protein
VIKLKDKSVYKKKKLKIKKVAHFKGEKSMWLVKQNCKTKIIN